jgi:predicted RNA-binding protein YlxR (DUF448 family)
MPATAQESELDRGATSVAAGTERTCALKRQVMPVSELVRFVVGPAGEVGPDVKRKLPGRGLWITGTRGSIAEAVRRSVFQRGFKRDLKVTPTLPADTERLLERAALDAMAIAAKAGLVVTGAGKVEAAIGREGPKRAGLLALVHASDAAADGKRKLAAALQRKRDEMQRETVSVETFTGQELSLALNRPNVVHAALLAGPGSETFIARVKRLERFRTGN